MWVKEFEYKLGKKVNNNKGGRFEIKRKVYNN